MFVNEQVDKSLEIKVKNIEYEQDAQRPFENQLYEFQVEWFYVFSMLTNLLEPYFDLFDIYDFNAIHKLETRMR